MDYKEYYEQRSRQRRKQRRHTIKPRFYAILAGFVAVVVLIIVLITSLGGDKYYTLGYGSYSSLDQHYTGFLIYDELVYYADDYSTVGYNVLQGQDVNAGDSILTTYSTAYTPQVMAQLEDVRTRIKERQQESILGKIVDSNLDSLNASVQSQVDAVVDASQNGTTNIASAAISLSQLMDARQTYIKNTNVALTDTTLTSLYSEETQILGNIEAYKTNYTAAQAGRVSFYFDGNESLLTTGLLDSLDLESVEYILSGGELSVDASIRAKQPMYRLVNPNHWYVAFIAPKDQWQSGLNTTVQITVDGHGTTVDARVIRVQTEDDQTLVLLETNADVSALINQRIVNFILGSNVQGLMVPNAALKTEGGQVGVYLESGTFVPVNILASDDENALVAPVTENALIKGSVIRAK